MKIRILCLLLAGCFISCYAKANTTPNEISKAKSDVLGGVYNSDSRTPIVNVQVTAYASNKKEQTVFTDVNGNFSFNDLKPGTYKFVFERDGYKKVVKEKTIARVDEGFQLNVQMNSHNYDFGPSHFFEL